MPPLAVTGLLTLATRPPLADASVTFTTDPATLDPHNWQMRQTIHKVIASGPGSGTVRQRRGWYASDGSVHIETGDTQWLNKDLIQTLLGWSQIPDATFLLTDSEGNSFQVVIDSLHPQPVMGLEGLYTLTMDLGVLGIVTLLGDPYTGD
jgi:hypothetical protein